MTKEKDSTNEKDSAGRSARRIPHVSPDWTTWSDDPFRLIRRPFAAFLEPEGYAALSAMKSPQTITYQRLVPATYALATALYEAIPQRRVWGCQIAGKDEEKKSWKTVTDGKWVKARRGGREFSFPEKPLLILDVLKSLTRGTALGTTDQPTRGDLAVRHVRVDVDMDITFTHAGSADLADLAAEVSLLTDIFAAFGLAGSIFRTGNRGIQVVAPLPPMPRSAGLVVTRMIQAVIRGSCHHPCRVRDFKTSTEGILRLPLGIHGASDSLGLFLGCDGRILPPSDQVRAALAGFGDPGGMGQLPTDTPNSHWNELYVAACARFEVRSPNVCKPEASELVSHTTPRFDNPVGEAGRDVGKPGQDVLPELVSHTTPSLYNSDGKPEKPPKTIWGQSPLKLKQIGWKVLHTGFEAGGSYAYYMNTTVNGERGKNAIGWSLVVHDGDQEAAREFLVKQARETPATTPESVNDRIGLIRRLIPLNNTYTRFQHRRAMRTHRALDADVQPQDTLAAQRIVGCLAALRAGKPIRTKVFQPGALVVIGHILELALAAAPTSEDGLLALSGRTLAAEIAARWPGCKTSQKAVSRHMVWITAGHEECLVEALVVVRKPMKATEATVYRLGPGMGS